MSCPAGYTFDYAQRPKRLHEAEIPLERQRYLGRQIAWTKNHVSASRLDDLRYIGDDLGDEAYIALKLKPGEDALQKLLEYTSRPESEQESSAPRRLLQQCMEVPEWVDWEKMKRGQEVVMRYFLYMAHIMVHFSLTYSFTAPKTSKVLVSTGYLSGAKTRIRVFETAIFVLESITSLENLQPGTGCAWKSYIQVRFLHSAVRTRLVRMSKAHSKFYNVEECGVPINQEDYLATLMSLSVSIWQVMETRMGVHMNQEEKSDLLHLWRYIGHYVGVEDVLNATADPVVADAVSESIAMHLLEPNPEGGKVVDSLFKNMSTTFIGPRTVSKSYRPSRYRMHMALAEQLLGSEVWDLCELPRITPLYKFVRLSVSYYMRLDLWMARKSDWYFRTRSALVHYKVIQRISGRLGHSPDNYRLKELPVDGGNYTVASHRGFFASLLPSSITSTPVVTSIVTSVGNLQFKQSTSSSKIMSMFLTTVASAAVCVGIAMAKRS
ncbi:hypothetical protein BX616_001455 [Lobosporangium transversale]|uniref:ER-bound oxygenase mpaB/mpaB'/Rubber oxygenase catalytic domain-containing protein n=1 Tax=Lobosporangium transversale TaxID=64571 RepID=A0A1Y2H2A8_9FUNG|nr:hypothetical protein BCR41DRAFT_343900 [Lobosporangium transversale]KAF9917285.1 hypothetical protein BX616_001455 [Lobosporangium transversale]ORZ28688.1 hypothetical protein BCR41DRAFT_343900 [Lobosporangium transversale]|eukprot:XP_021886361.1 hypothetical protein BCR41DRAFT_343900 [Lobosporangium transversale]